MNGGFLPLLLLGAALGLALALAPPRTALLALGAMVAGALLLAFMPIPASSSEAIFVGLWLSVIAIAALTFVPRRIADRLMLGAGLNAGIWAGALAAVSDLRGGLALALLFALSCAAARWLPLRDYVIVIKVVASWTIAIAALSMFVSLMPTPGYKPDHME